MKAIPLKTIIAEGIPEPMVYKTHIIDALRNPSNPQGVDYAEMAVIIPILQKVKACEDDVLLLEDAEHDCLVRQMRSAKFRFVVPEIYEMMKEIIEAPDHLTSAKSDASA